MPIAREGYRYIVLFLGIALILEVIPSTRLLGMPCLALGLVCAFFFRDPTRVAPAEPNLLVSPADGKVVYAGPRQDGRLGEQVDIFLSIFDVHINRAPIAGKVSRIQYTPGRFHLANRREASRENERNELDFVDGDYVVTVRQIAGLIARRIVCRVKKNDRVVRGQRFGLIQFGSRTEILMPPGTVIRVKVGDRVLGGESVVAERR